jgi:predicted acylesterase/phospholipase RssA
MKNALVVSGGGSRGAFAVGAIEVLHEAGKTFDIVAGTSTGALIAPLIVTDDLQLLRSIYSSVRTDDIIRKRDAVEVLTKDALYDSHPLWSLINSFITEERYRQILASEADGGPVSRRTLLRAVFASASIPVMMPPVEILEGGDQHVDGGVREIAPLKIVIDHGATDVYAIVLEPEERQRSNEEYRFVVKTLTRTMNIFTQEVLLNDVRHAQLINQGVRYLANARARAEERLSEEDVSALFDDPAVSNPFREARVLNVHVIRPERELPSSGLEFRPLVMSQMMELGRLAAEKTLQEGPLDPVIV